MTASIAVVKSSSLESDIVAPRDGDSTLVMTDASTDTAIKGGEEEALDGHADILPVAIEVCRAFLPFILSFFSSTR